MAKTEQTQLDDEKRANFENVMGKRMATVRDKIVLIKKGANPNAYAFTRADVDKMVSDVKKWADEINDVYTAALNGEKTAAPQDVYKF